MTPEGSRAEEFYSEHREKFFYNRLVTFMSSGPCQPLILASQDAISRWRELMGPTKAEWSTAVVRDSHEAS